MRSKDLLESLTRAGFPVPTKSMLSSLLSDIDPYWELKEAIENGKVIEFNHETDKWSVLHKPVFNQPVRYYRIQAEIPEGFVRWSCDGCEDDNPPVPTGTPVEVVFRNGVKDKEKPSDWYRWSDLNHNSDIVGYRVIHTEITLGNLVVTKTDFGLSVTKDGKPFNNPIAAMMPMFDRIVELEKQNG